MTLKFTKIFLNKILVFILSLILILFISCTNGVDKSNSSSGSSSSTGALTYMDRYSSISNIHGASSVAVSEDGKNVYVTASGADAVAWFTRD